MEYSLPLPLRFRWSVFFLQLLPHEYLSGPSTHFHHHSHGLSGDAYLAQKKYYTALKRSLPILSQPPLGYSPQYWQDNLLKNQK